MASDIYKIFEGTVDNIDVPVQDVGTDYTPSTGRMFILRAAAFYNGNDSIQKTYLKVGNTYIISSQLQPLSSVLTDSCNAILQAGEKICLKADILEGVNYRIWGIEIDI